MPQATRDTKELVRALLRARGRSGDDHWGGGVFFVGAGCSVSAGIPLAKTIAEECIVDLAQRYCLAEPKPESPSAAFEWLKNEGHLSPHLEWREAYNELFTRHYRAPVEQRGVIGAALAKGEQTNSFHSALGILIKERFVHTVLTTNFDKLISRAAQQFVAQPHFVDDISNLKSIYQIPSRPQIIHLHGSDDTYYLRNSEEDLRAVASKPSVVGSVFGLLSQTPFLVVIGYSGVEPGVMDIMIDVARDVQNMAIYWILYESDPSALAPKAEQFLATSSNSTVLVDQDADSLLMRLLSELGIDAQLASAAPPPSRREVIAPTLERIPGADHEATVGHAQNEMLDERFESALRRGELQASRKLMSYLPSPEQLRR